MVTTLFYSKQYDRQYQIPSRGDSRNNCTLQQQEAESLTFQLANDAYEGIIAAGSFAQYAEGTHPGIDIQETDFFTRSTAPTILKTDTQFLDKAFALNKGELSSLIKGQSGYAILYAEDIKQPQIPAFEAKKDILTRDYKKAQAQELAEKAATDLRAEPA